MYREVLVVQRRTLGPEHPDTSTTVASLANTLARQGKYGEAETMLREVLAIKRRLFGPEHPETLATAGDLAITLKSQGEHTEAETLNRETLVIERRVLGAEHLATLTTATNLASTLGVQGKYAEAEPSAARCLRSSGGCWVPRTRARWRRLASWQMRSTHTGAAKMYRETLAIEQRVLGPEHPSSLRTAMNLASCLEILHGRIF
jgi:hypothetical protein